MAADKASVVSATKPSSRKTPDISRRVPLIKLRCLVSFERMAWLLTQQVSCLQPRVTTVGARPKAERRRPKADLTRVDALGA